MTIASTPPFEPHPSRQAVLAEAHARPFFRLEAPARVLALAFLRGTEAPEALRARLDAARSAIDARCIVCDPDTRTRKLSVTLNAMFALGSTVV